MMTGFKFEQILYTWRYKENGMNGIDGMGLYASSSTDSALNNAAAETAAPFELDYNGNDADISRFVIYSRPLHRFVGIRVSFNASIANHFRTEPLVHVFVPERVSDDPADYLVDYPFDNVSMEDQLNGILPKGPITIPSAVFDEADIMKKMGFASDYEDVFEDPDDPAGSLAVLIRLLFRCMTGEEAEKIIFSYDREEDSPFSDPACDDRSAAELIWMLSFLIPYSGDKQYLHNLTYSINASRNRKHALIGFTDRKEGIRLGRGGISLQRPADIDEFFLKAAEKVIKEGLTAAKTFIQEVMEDSSNLKKEPLHTFNVQDSYRKWKMNKNGYLDYSDIETDFSTYLNACRKNLWYREFLADFVLKGKNLDDNVRESIWKAALMPNLKTIEKYEGFEHLGDYTYRACGAVLNQSSSEKTRRFLQAIPKEALHQVLEMSLESGGNVVREILSSSESGREFVIDMDQLENCLNQSEELQETAFSTACKLYPYEKDAAVREKISEYMDRWRPEKWENARKEEIGQKNSLDRLKRYLIDFGSCIEKKYLKLCAEKLLNILRTDSEPDSSVSCRDISDTWEITEKVRADRFPDLDFHEEKTEIARIIESRKKEEEKKSILDLANEGRLTELMEMEWSSISYSENKDLWICKAIEQIQQKVDAEREEIEKVLGMHEGILSRILGLYTGTEEQDKKVNQLEKSYNLFAGRDFVSLSDRYDLWKERSAIIKKSVFFRISDRLEYFRKQQYFWKDVRISEEDFSYIYEHSDAEDIDMIDSLDIAPGQYSDEESLVLNVYRAYQSIRMQKIINTVSANTIGGLYVADQEKALRICSSCIDLDNLNLQVTKDNLMNLIYFMGPRMRLQEYARLYDRGALNAFKDFPKRKYGYNFAPFKEEMQTYNNLRKIADSFDLEDEDTQKRLLKWFCSYSFNPMWKSSTLFLRASERLGQQKIIGDEDQVCKEKYKNPEGERSAFGQYKRAVETKKFAASGVYQDRAADEKQNPYKDINNSALQFDAEIMAEEKKNGYATGEDAFSHEVAEICRLFENRK